MVRPFDAHVPALGLQPHAAAGRARPQRAVVLERLPLRPRALVVAAAQVRHEPFEVDAEGILAPCRGPTARLASAVRRRAVQQHVALLLRQLTEGRRGRCRAPRRGARTLRSTQRCVAARPRRDGPGDAGVGCSSGTMRAGSKSYVRAEPLALLARAVRRVEREGARRHLGHADAAVDAREPPREQAIALPSAADHAPGRPPGRARHRPIPQPALDARLRR